MSDDNEGESEYKSLKKSYISDYLKGFISKDELDEKIEKLNERMDIIRPKRDPFLETELASIHFFTHKGDARDQLLARGLISKEECNILDFRDFNQRERLSIYTDQDAIRFNQKIITENQEKIRSGVLTFWDPRNNCYFKRKATKAELETLKRKGII